MKALALISVSALALVAQSAAAPTQAPSLGVARFNPLVVRGRHFSPAERVRVILSTPDFRKTRRTTAGDDGTFTVDFGNVHLGPCLRFGLRAVGSDGSRAVLTQHPLPACMPVSSP
jgi:hypothetical protein